MTGTTITESKRGERSNPSMQRKQQKTAVPLNSTIGFTKRKTETIDQLLRQAMTRPLICIRCAGRLCEKSIPDQLDICDYGVAFYNKDGKIFVKDTLVPLSMISTNMRHELHKFLQGIVSEINALDETLTTRHIDLNSPPSRIVGLTIAIDHFVQMLAGVNEFHTLSFPPNAKELRRLSEIVRKYFSVHSIIRNERRVIDLQLDIDFSDNLYITVFIEIFEYLCSIFMDNVWKYSLPGTIVSVSALRNSQGLADLKFSNKSPPLPQGFDVFAKGNQVDANSEGFGYGLFWGSVLVEHYNSLTGEDYPALQLIHEENRIRDDLSEQKFILKNVPIEMKS